MALEIFHYQYLNNALYRQFTDLNHYQPDQIDHFTKIPFLPIEFFKTHTVICGKPEAKRVFTSSGTGGSGTSKHFIKDLSLYHESLFSCFGQFYGDPQDYLILALLPSYLGRRNSSLVYMTEQLIRKSNQPGGGFYLFNYDELLERISSNSNHKILLIGVSFALLEFANKHELPAKDIIVMETGGMKGRGKEIIREELHEILRAKFHVPEIHSEYGMTELLSQAYSSGKGIFNTPSWMQVLIRDINDPRSLPDDNQTGGINVIDLANLHSCSFIATKDLGRKFNDGSFELLGRFDHSDIRGCNLLVT